MRESAAALFTLTQRSSRLLAESQIVRNVTVCMVVVVAVAVALVAVVAVVGNVGVIVDAVAVAILSLVYIWHRRLRSVVVPEM